MQKRITAVALMFLCMFGLLFGMGKSVAHAGNAATETPFSGDVGLLKQDNGNYVMQVTVENSGEDFYGTVQVIFSGTNGAGNCAYNTEISLPAQGKKQFTLTVSDRAVDTIRGLCTVNFLDEKEKLIQSISLKNVFGNIASGISVGILSDHFSELTYLDAGGMGMSVDIRGTEYPLKLLELNAGNLEGYLDGLYFLIIDQFNVSALGEETIRAIEEWVEKGGWLIIGTGAYAEQTLSGFDQDFLDISVIDISEPGNANFLSEAAENYGYYYGYTMESEIDFTQMSVADLGVNLTNSYEDPEHPAVFCPIGDGAAAVYYLSLGEKEMQKLDQYVIQSMYNVVMYESNSINSFDRNSDMEYVGQRALALIDSRNTNVDFSFLKILIGVYVVLAGPVLYLILRKCRKSEWYWIGVPILGLLFIAGVFFIGHGARLNETRAYSVTVQRADSNRADTYFLAYHSGIKAWNVHLKDRYDVAGPGWGGNRYYSYNMDTSDYYYMVGNDSEGLSIGIKPRENFESGFLYAGGKAEAKGVLSGAELRTDIATIAGTITNDTSCDLAYMAVWGNDYIMVFSDVKAGETLDLQQAEAAGRCVYQGSADYYDNLLYTVYSTRPGLGYEQDDMAVLLIGLGVADENRLSDKNYAVIAGVVRDYEKAIVDKCNETAYGCLYSFAEMEVGQNAAN